MFELRNSRWMFFGLACLEINYTLSALTFLAKVIDHTEPSRFDDNDNINYEVPVKATQQPWYVDTQVIEHDIGMWY